MKTLTKLVVFTLLMVMTLMAFSQSPSSASEQNTPSFDQLLEQRDWTPLETAGSEAPNGDKMSNFAWTNIFVPKDYGASRPTHYVSSTVCGGGVYVYWWGIPSASISTLGVWSSNVLNQLHIQSWGGLNGHYECFIGNRCDVRLCAKSGFGYSPSNTMLKY